MSSTSDVSSMDELYPELSKLLKNNKIKVKVFEAYKDIIDELEEAENLINDLKRLGCEKGLEDKFGDISDAEKFGSAVSELRVAKILLNNKYDVELLSDNDPHFIKKSPDIICTTGTFTTYVEVAKFNASSSKYIMNLIQKQIECFVQYLPYRIYIYLKEELSIPKVKGEERNKQIQSVLNSLETFKKSFDQDMQPQVPLNLPNDAGAFTFTIKETELEQGFLFILSSPLAVPSTLIKCLEKYKIDNKNKAYGFTSEQRNNPFIIAIDLHMLEIKDEDVNILLYGLVDLYPKEIKEYWVNSVAEVYSRDSWEKIRRAQSKGWDSFLREKFLIPNNETLNCINRDKEGKFVSDSMEDVSAVLLIDNNNKCFFYPNPFCRDEINNPEIVNFINTNEKTEVQK